MKRPVLLLLILLAAVPACSAELYRWVDKDGTVSFSDNPPPANQAVEKRYMVKASEKATEPTRKVHPEIAELETAARAQQRRHDKMQLQLKLKLLEAQQLGGLQFKNGVCGRPSQARDGKSGGRSHNYIARGPADVFRNRHVRRGI
jgi:hypothetical protein